MHSEVEGLLRLASLLCQSTQPQTTAIFDCVTSQLAKSTKKVTCKEGSGRAAYIFLV
jgi:hypothetical protein